MRTKIINGRVIDPSLNRDEVCDVLIEDGTIVKTGNTAEDADEIIDAAGCIVAPGFVDAHVHFRDPGFTYKEDIYSGARAAAHGGYTSVVMMANTRPVIDCPEVLDQVLAKGRKTAIHVYSAACITKFMEGKELTDFAALKEHGAVLLTDDGLPILNANIAYEAMEEAVKYGFTLSFHEEDPELIYIKGINDGNISRELGMKGARSSAEEILVARDCVLSRTTHARIHIQHVSSGFSVDLIRKAKADGIPVTCEVTPQHFSLNEEIVREKGTLAKVNPPIRTEQDRQEILKGIQDGTIDIIATDHAPHSREEKLRPFHQAPSGMIGLETALGLGIRNLVNTGVISMSHLISMMSTKPAQMFSLNGGTLQEGKAADLVIFNPDKTWTAGNYLSKASNSPFTGMELPGAVEYTICNGKIAYHH